MESHKMRTFFSDDSSGMKNSTDFRIPVSFHSEKSIQFSFDAPFL